MTTTMKESEDPIPLCATITSHPTVCGAVPSLLRSFRRMNLRHPTNGLHFKPATTNKGSTVLLFSRLPPPIEAGYGTPSDSDTSCPFSTRRIDLQFDSSPRIIRKDSIVLRTLHTSNNTQRAGRSPSASSARSFRHHLATTSCANQLSRCFYNTIPDNPFVSNDVCVVGSIFGC